MDTEFLFGRQYLEGVRVNYQSRVSVGALGGHLTRFRYEEIVSYPLHFQYPIGAQEKNSHLNRKEPELGFWRILLGLLRITFLRSFEASMGVWKNFCSYGLITPTPKRLLGPNQGSRSLSWLWGCPSLFFNSSGISVGKKMMGERRGMCVGR